MKFLIWEASFFIIHRAHPRAKRMARWMMKNEAAEPPENLKLKSNLAMFRDSDS
jgi:hypothetical protein